MERIISEFEDEIVPFAAQYRSGIRPFIGYDDELVAGVLDGSLRLPRPKGCKKNGLDDLWKVSQACRNYDPNRRPSFVELKRRLEDLQKRN